MPTASTAPERQWLGMGGRTPTCALDRNCGNKLPRRAMIENAELLSVGKLCEPHLQGTYVNLKAIARSELRGRPRHSHRHGIHKHLPWYCHTNAAL